MPFQALIGTAKTTAWSSSGPSSSTFQALIGTAKTRIWIASASRFRGFQALIGTAKTVRSFVRRERIRLVSSPHRYCQNNLHVVRLPTYLQFQALIGTAKTRRPSASETRMSWFQALIGTAKTRCRRAKHPNYHTFQALIGTAKTTEGSVLEVCSHSLVSSPHRYCQNVRSGSSSWVGGSFKPS